MDAALNTVSPFLPYETVATGSWPEAVAIGDVNGDGRNDVVMVTGFDFDAANDHMLNVWTQNADGTLAPRVLYLIGELSTSPTSVAVGDVNNDGRNDVVVAKRSGLGVLIQNPQGTLNPIDLHATTNAYLVRIADLNHDGLQDLVGVGWGTGTVSVFLQQTSGTLAAQVLYSAPHGGWDDLEVGDVNGDGLTDVIVMSGQGFFPHFSILYQQQDGTLGGAVSRTVDVHQGADGIGVGDVTGDSRNDVVISSSGPRQLGVFPQQPDGSLLMAPSFSRPLPYPKLVEVGDVTSDGRSDVVVSATFGAIALFRQLPEGVLDDGQLLPLPDTSHLNPHGLALGDINGDGHQDLVVASYDSGLIVYRNAGPPPVVVTGPATTITQSSAVLNATVNPKGAATDGFYQYGLTGSYGSATAPTALGSGVGGAGLSIQVSGLVCGTTYHFRAVAMNSRGTTNGLDNTFMTDPCPPVVVTGGATSVTDSTAVLNATVNPKGSATNGFYQYGLNVGYGATTAATAVGSGVAAVGLPIPVRDLACNTTYHFRAAASNIGGATYALDSTFTTSTCPPPPTVTTNGVADITQTGATLLATLNPNGGVTYRRFEYGLTQAYGLITPEVEIGYGGAGVPVGFVVTGMACNTLYHYRAAGRNSGGTGYGGDLTFTTAACPAPGSNNIGALTARTLTLNSTSRDSMSNVRAETWFRVRLFSGRSYQVSAWPVDHEQAVDAPALDPAIFSDDAGAVTANPAPVIRSGAAEGSPNHNGDVLPSSLTFQPATTGVYKIRILRSSGGTVAHSVNVAVRETTLFSSWTSRAAGFEGFIEMHNNTDAAADVTLRAYDSTGTLLGTGITFSIPANATVFKTANETGVPVNVFAGIVLTHDGALGAISANITTLNGANGLSFDSPFAPRNEALSGPPVR